MGLTKIEWTDQSVNPIRANHLPTGKTGHYCEKISPGCAHCYASGLQWRFGTPEFVAGQKRGEFEIFLDAAKLLQVTKRRKPTMWFWCDMTDLFGEWVPDWMIDHCFDAMAKSPQHTHQILTKRAERAFRYCTKHPMPLNVWVGMSVENQTQADERHQWQCPAAVTFWSAEPLIGPIDPFDTWTHYRMPDWVIIGGESGHNARPCDVDWIRSLVHRCQRSCVPVFVKQLGSKVFDRRSVGIHSQIAENECWPLGEATKTDHTGRVYLKHHKGGDPDEWPEDLRVREWPKAMVPA